MKLKNLIPFDSIKLHTRLSSREVQDKLESVTEPRRMYFFVRRRSKPYEGKITTANFRVNRTNHFDRSLNNRNSFIPFIKGSIESIMGGTEIRFKMRPASFALIFMAFWLGIVGFVCITILINIFLNLKKTFTQGLSPAAIIPFIMFAIGYGMVIFGYRLESNKSKKYFKELLEAEEC